MFARIFAVVFSFSRQLRFVLSWETFINTLFKPIRTQPYIERCPAAFSFRLLAIKFVASHFFGAARVGKEPTDWIFCLSSEEQGKVEAAGNEIVLTYANLLYVLLRG